jgi:TnpA family transposase
VRQNYIRAETLTRANAALVAAQNRIPLAHAWGGGDVASADGLRFVMPVRTIHSGPNPTRNGYDALALTMLLNAKPAEVRGFLAGTLASDRAREFTEQVRIAGVPI